MLICFLGIDGSGKTTCALELHKQLTIMGFSCKYVHFESIFIHKLLKLYMKFNTNSSNESNSRDKNIPNCQACPNPIASKLFIYVLFIDNFIFYILNIFNSKEKILICDRYYLDNFINYSYLRSNSKIIENAYRMIFRNPDLTFFLNLDPIIAYNRKHEDSLEYLRFKKSIYMNICLKKLNHVVELDSTIDIKNLSPIILNEVVKLIG